MDIEDGLMDGHTEDGLMDGYTEDGLMDGHRGLTHGWT